MHEGYLSNLTLQEQNLKPEESVFAPLAIAPLGHIVTFLAFNMQLCHYVPERDI